MKTHIELKLHNDAESNQPYLDSQDVYAFIGETSKEELEVAYYIDKWCEYLNYHIEHNNEMMFGDTTLARLEGWLTGYNHAKHLEIHQHTDKIEINMRKYFITLEKPRTNGVTI